MMERIQQLNDLDIEQFSELTRQESFTWDGQMKKMALIRGMIERRIHLRNQEAMLTSLSAQSSPGKSGIIRSVHAGQKVKMHTVDIDREKGRYNLLVEKGSDNALLHILVPAHIDTVGIDDNADLLSFQRHPSNADIAIGRGVYDMGAAVLNNIALASDVQVPEGIKVIFAFTADEELTSAGAKALINPNQVGAWDWGKIDIVLSSEIGHIEVPENDTSMRYITGRRGRHKFSVKLSVHEQAQGHGAEEHVRNASHAMGEALYGLNDAFYHGCSFSEQRLQRELPAFGREKLSIGEMHSYRKKGFFQPSTAVFDYDIQTVPVSERTLPATLKEQGEVFRRISEINEWNRHSITYALSETPGETSYEPYLMPSGHPLNDVVARVLTRVSGGAVEALAPSVGDENLYATALKSGIPQHSFEDSHKGVVTLPIRGDNAHRTDEYVDLSDAARVRHAMTLLLSHPEGVASLLPLVRAAKNT